HRCFNSPLPLISPPRASKLSDIHTNRAGKQPASPLAGRAIAYGLRSSFFLPSPRRKSGSRATGTPLQPWIPAFAWMTKWEVESHRPKCDHPAWRGRVGVGGDAVRGACCPTPTPARPRRGGGGSAPASTPGTKCPGGGRG